jgi:invasion protein IalB
MLLHGFSERLGKIIRATVFLTLACGPAAGAEGQSPPVTKFGAWEMQCSTSAGAKTPLCALTQTVRSEEQPSANTMVAFRKIPGSTKGILQIIAPPNSFLIEGAKIKVDQDEVGALPFFRCNQIGCAAEGGMSDDITNKLLTGKNMLVTIYINPGEGLRNIFALDGFKDGYKSLQ